MNNFSSDDLVYLVFIMWSSMNVMFLSCFFLVPPSARSNQRSWFVCCWPIALTWHCTPKLCKLQKARHQKIQYWNRTAVPCNVDIVQNHQLPMSPTAPESECPELVCGITSRLTDDLPDKSFLNPTVTITRLTVFSFRAAIHLNQLQILKANTNCLSRNMILIWCR